MTGTSKADMVIDALCADLKRQAREIAAGKRTVGLTVELHWNKGGIAQVRPARVAAMSPDEFIEAVARGGW